MNEDRSRDSLFWGFRTFVCYFDLLIVIMLLHNLQSNGIISIEENRRSNDFDRRTVSCYGGLYSTINCYGMQYALFSLMVISRFRKVVHFGLIHYFRKGYSMLFWVYTRRYSKKKGFSNSSLLWEFLSICIHTTHLQYDITLFLHSVWLDYWYGQDGFLNLVFFFIQCCIL